MKNFYPFMMLAIVNIACASLPVCDRECVCSINTRDDVNTLNNECVCCTIAFGPTIPPGATVTVVIPDLRRGTVYITTPKTGTTLHTNVTVRGRRTMIIDGAHFGIGAHRLAFDGTNETNTISMGNSVVWGSASTMANSSVLFSNAASVTLTSNTFSNLTLFSVSNVTTTALTSNTFSNLTLFSVFNGTSVRMLSNAINGGLVSVNNVDNVNVESNVFNNSATFSQHRSRGSVIATDNLFYGHNPRSAAAMALYGGTDVRISLHMQRNTHHVGGNYGNSTVSFLIAYFDGLDSIVGMNAGDAYLGILVVTPQWKWHPNTCSCMTGYTDVPYNCMRCMGFYNQLVTRVGLSSGEECLDLCARNSYIDEYFNNKSVVSVSMFKNASVHGNDLKISVYISSNVHTPHLRVPIAHIIGKPNHPCSSYPVDFDEIGDTCVPSNNINNVVSVAKQHEWDLTVIDPSSWLLQLRWITSYDLTKYCGATEDWNGISGYVCPQLTVCETETTEAIPCFYYAYNHQQSAVISMTDDAVMHFYVYDLIIKCEDAPRVFTLYVETASNVGPLRDMRIFRQNSSYASAPDGRFDNRYRYTSTPIHVQVWQITAVDFDTPSLIYGDVQVSATLRRIAFTVSISVSCTKYATSTTTSVPIPVDSSVKTDSNPIVFIVIEISLVISMICGMYMCVCCL